ncbi:MAG TPA: gephyrin-like molybdotransferase Glp [Nocardioidaceae bacterium]|nr:gephyrin-like molybdotransferase Glp [Nocardioidaceae bacterium]
MATAHRTVDEHLQHILDTVSPLSPYDQPLLESLGLPVCEDISAPIDLPGFDNSAMDGYAVRREDVAAAAEGAPVSLPVVGELAAGQTKADALSPRTALKIMTGAPIPVGADSVVPVEWTDAGVASVLIRQAPPDGLYVRRRGEDVETGTKLLEIGRVVGPREVGLLAAIGRSRVLARPRPRVVVLSTGTELREPGSELAHDSVYDSNSYQLAAAARACGAIAYRVGGVPDEPELFSDVLSDQLVRADLVVTSGGVSKGDYDIVKEVLSKLGTVTFAEVALQPGKPQGFGTVGEDSTPIFALPGNPVAAYVSFETFVVPAIRRMMGRLPYRRPAVPATVADPIDSPPGRRQLVRGLLNGDDPEARVHVVGGHASHLIGDLAQSNALIVVPEDTTRVEAGSTVDVLVLDREF